MYIKATMMKSARVFDIFSFYGLRIRILELLNDFFLTVEKIRGKIVRLLNAYLDSTVE